MGRRSHQTPFSEVLHRSMSEPALEGGGLICAPNKYVPPIDGSVAPAPNPVGRGGEFGDTWPDGYVRCLGIGANGTMIWPGNVSHKRVKPPRDGQQSECGRAEALNSPLRSAAPSGRLSNADLA